MSACLMGHPMRGGGEPVVKWMGTYVDAPVRTHLQNLVRSAKSQPGEQGGPFAEGALVGGLLEDHLVEAATPVALVGHQALGGRVHPARSGVGERQEAGEEASARARSRTTYGWKIASSHMPAVDEPRIRAVQLAAFLSLEGGGIVLIEVAQQPSHRQDEVARAPLGPRRTDLFCI
jgi:hypothetical protein